MPAVRLSTRRRRSSLANLAGLNPIKPGQYGISSRSPRAVTFAPNVTPGTYSTDPAASLAAADPDSKPEAQLFPVVDAPSTGAKPDAPKRRAPPGRRRSVGHVPRPPNAFMLFRANFVKQKHVPGSIETNHGSLSRIIGNCWRQLPLLERAYWEKEAAAAKALHKQTYPDYKFRPIHTKHKDRAGAGKKDKHVLSPEEERRLEDVALLLIEGKRGAELSEAVRELDEERAKESGNGSARATESPAPLPPLSPPPPYERQQTRFHRRSSSVPPPMQYMHHLQYQPQQPQSMGMGMGMAPIALPALPFLSSLSRPASPPVGNISRTVIGQRRPSSVQPIPSRPWGYDFDQQPYGYEQHFHNPTADLYMADAPVLMQRSPSPLPEADTTIWDQNFLGSGGFSQTSAQSHPEAAFNVHGLMESLDTTCAQPSFALEDTISPLDGPHHPELTIRIPYPISGDLETPSAWPHSEPSTAYSGSPAPSEHVALHHQHQQHPELHAPVPQQAVPKWTDYHMGGFEPSQQQQQQEPTMDSGLENYHVGIEHLGLNVGDMFAGADLGADGMYDASAYADVLGVVCEEATPPAHGYEY
ncbi:hypothetical protein PUNSTDRAFT_143890 [Punctularia strigosozonata HHB-11173 SS5]|uniref:uncharacterized protein n=1 Tax=Punctularia strigosozonata (strain HHB-11173) TaxID=741275 RepID=UPI00044170D5|nr:uncharacterized protein PUNSTDRAFT_143890 [Punctularia strigosozonata HHB-11173 SS5]EIN08248.1 hypothetical protein PUNSTDRAFT_143890 [Punctularia strigosozonata HHB-11173 SS5]